MGIISDRVDGGKPKHILWACAHMKLSLLEYAMCLLLETTKPTLQKWV